MGRQQHKLKSAQTPKHSLQEDTQMASETNETILYIINYQGEQIKAY